MPNDASEVEGPQGNHGITDQRKAESSQAVPELRRHNDGYSDGVQ
jgi:hypothetical protein